MRKEKFYIIFTLRLPQIQHIIKWIYGKQKFSGVGGHLFAIAGDLSVRRGYEGFVYGEAMDKKLLDYYCDNFGAEYFPSPKGPYGVLIPSAAMENIMEVYSYAWSNENL